MIEFHAPTPADKAWVDELLARGNYRGCDYNFTNLYVWSRAYNQRIARVDDFLVTHVCGRLGCAICTLRAPETLPPSSVRWRPTRRRRGSPCAWCASRPADGGAGGIFPGRFAYTADRDGYDYLYEVERLAELGGQEAPRQAQPHQPLCREQPHLDLRGDHPGHPARVPGDGQGVVPPLPPAGGRRRGAGSGETRESPCAPPWSTMRSWALRAASSGYTARWVAFTIGDRLSADTYDVHFEKA